MQNFRKIKLFLHKLIINKLSDRDFKGLTDEQKIAIQEGFCYTLAMDWLFQPMYAQKYYFDCKLKENDQINLTLDRILYFSTLAIWFQQYQKYIQDYYNISTIYTNSNNIQYNSIAHKDLFAIDNHFATLHYKERFDNWYNCDSNSLDNFFNYTTKKYCNCCLFHIINKDSSNNIFKRHTIAARLKVNRQSGVNEFHFFDPQYGVYAVYDLNKNNKYLPALFLRKLFISYKQYYLDFVAAHCSYKNFVF